jgi:hypothetical protein
LATAAKPEFPKFGIGLPPGRRMKIQVQQPKAVIASVSEAIQLSCLLLDGLLRRIRLRPKAGFGGQECASQ